MEYLFVERPGIDDIAGITALYSEAGWWGRSDNQQEGLLERLVAGSHCFLICVAGGEIVAMGRAISDRASDAYIQDIYVKPGYRGKGIGAEVTQRIVRRLQSDGMRWIGLISTPEAKGLYARLGFQEINRAAMLLKTGDDMQC